MVKREREHLLASNLPALQNLIKRDPQAYREELLLQLRHFESTLQIFLLKPTDDSDEFCNLCNLLSHVAHCYPKELAHFPGQLIDLLSQQYTVLLPSVRRSLVQSLILLRNKKLVPTVQVLELFFQMFRCPDKGLREMLFKHIVADIKNENAKAKNNQLNTLLQNFMFTMLKDADEVAARKSLEVMIELYRKNIWNDAKTVNIIVQAALSEQTKVMVTAVRFFLSSDEKQPEEDSSDDDNNAVDLRDVLHKNRVGKKTKKREMQIERAKKAAQRRLRQKDKGLPFNFSALHLINDPQGFAEKLLARLRKSNEIFDIRLLVMNLISRLIGVHQLQVLAFYPYLQRYLQPHQRDVTHILVAAAQATHSLVPPDAIEPLVMALANNFVSDHNSAEAMTVGLNAIREIVARCPLAMTDTLLQDLAQYKSHRDKGVMNAARSLIGLFRDVNPEMLHKKDRGKAAAIAASDDAAPTPVGKRLYGEVPIADHVDGAELLQLIAERKRAAGGDGDGSDAESDGSGRAEDEEEDGWDGWEVASDEEEDDDDGEWITVEHSDDEETAAPADEEEVALLTTKVERPPEKMIESQRILSPADFAAIKELQAKRELARAGLMGGRKRKRDESTDKEAPSTEEKLDPSVLMQYTKKPKATYEERMAAVEEGREGRGKYGSNKGQKEHVGKTNAHNKKNKAFSMIKHKKEVRAKTLRSLRDKQMAARAAIDKRKRQVH